VETTLQAVNITVAGMGLIFFALALVMVAMVGLDRLFPGEARSPGGPSQPPPPAPPTAVRLHAVVGEKTFLLEAKGGDGKARQFAVGERVFKVEHSKSATGEMLIDGEPFRVEILSLEGGKARVRVGGQTLEVAFAEAPAEAVRIPEAPRVSPPTAVSATVPSAPAAAMGAPVGQPIPAPLPGKILRVAVAVGERVEAGQELCILEAMKMENSIKARVAGVVCQMAIQPGQNVSPGDPLMWIG